MQMDEAERNAFQAQVLLAEAQRFANYLSRALYRLAALGYEANVEVTRETSLGGELPPQADAHGDGKTRLALGGIDGQSNPVNSRI